MKHLILLFVSAGICVPTVSAQTKDFSTQACERRCKDADLDGPGIEPYKQKLAQLRDQKKLETSVEKRKALELEEARALERRDAFVGRSCRYICTGE